MTSAPLSETILLLAGEAEDAGNGYIATVLTIVAGTDIDTDAAERADKALRLASLHAESHRTAVERDIIARAIRALHGDA